MSNKFKCDIMNREGYTLEVGSFPKGGVIMIIKEGENKCSVFLNEDTARDVMEAIKEAIESSYEK